MNQEQNNRISTQDATKDNCGITRNYKDRLFCKVFENKKDLLSLYNAVNNTEYTDTDALEVNTLEDVIYLGMKNDKSFLISDTLNLYEHQSTQNPNLPLRGLFYFSRLYEGFVDNQGIRIYGRTHIKLPTPQYVVFYNGIAEEPDRSVLHLSDAYLQKDIPPALECTAVMLNVNYGHNKALMEKCRKLKEYAFLIAAIRRHLNEGNPLREAVTAAVDECIRKMVLKDVLMKHKAEVIGMILTTFDQEEYEQTIRDESYTDGHNEGLTDGRLLTLISLTRKKLHKGLSPEDIADLLEEDIAVIKAICSTLKEENISSDADALNALKNFPGIDQSLRM